MPVSAYRSYNASSVADTIGEGWSSYQGTFGGLFMAAVGTLSDLAYSTMAWASGGK
jgi:hypothetical protein